MKTHSKTLFTAFALISSFADIVSAQPGKGHLEVPPVPANLQAPSGHTAYLKGLAVGTQNYVCLSTAKGPAWTFQGPQATLFVKIPWVQGELKKQIATHFLSPNPNENGLARPTWQNSFDTSTVWGKAVASSQDPAFVQAGAIPWLLVQIVGSQGGPMGDSLVGTTYIQRVNTSGGTAPSTGCNETTIGSFAFVPYSTDYYFYQAIK